MPLFKGLSSKSTPRKAIDYITRKDKAAFVSVRNLFEDEDYAEQFADTMRRFGKGKKFNERKYYHFKCNALIERQNTLIEDLTMTVKSLDGANARNARDLKESVSSAVVEIKNLQAETRSLNNRVATETSNAIKRATTTLENELRKTIQTQSVEVFAEVKKELDKSKQLLESTREELKVERGFRKFLFWATPILLLAQTIAIILSAL